MSFRILEFVTDDTVTLPYQLKENGLPKDITGLTFEFAARELPGSAVYKIDPVVADIDDVATGLFSFAIDLPAAPFNGVYEIVMKSGADETTLTPPGGIEITVSQDIIRP